MGLSLGGSTGGTSSSATGSEVTNKTPTYTGEQGGLQSALSMVLQSMIPAAGAGTISPNVQAVETGNADQINKTSASTGTAMNRFLAARGMGQSGQSGQVALQTELGRQAALGANASSAGGMQLQQNQSTLADALTFAFTNPGQYGTDNATQSSNSFGWKAGGGISF